MYLYFYGLTAVRFCISQWLHIVLYLSVTFSPFLFPDMEKAKCFHTSYFKPRSFVTWFFPSATFALLRDLFKRVQRMLGTHGLEMQLPLSDALLYFMA